MSLYEYESDCKSCSATCDVMYLPFIKVSQIIAKHMNHEQLYKPHMEPIKNYKYDAQWSICL